MLRVMEPAQPPEAPQPMITMPPGHTFIGGIRVDSLASLSSGGGRSDLDSVSSRKASSPKPFRSNAAKNICLAPRDDRACRFRYTDLGSLKKHLRRTRAHTGMAPYFCTVENCHVTKAQADQFTPHLCRDHDMDPETANSTVKLIRRNFNVSGRKKLLETKVHDLVHRHFQRLAESNPNAKIPLNLDMLDDEGEDNSDGGGSDAESEDNNSAAAPYDETESFEQHHNNLPPAGHKPSNVRTSTGSLSSRSSMNVSNDPYFVPRDRRESSSSLTMSTSHTNRRSTIGSNDSFVSAFRAQRLEQSSGSDHGSEAHHVGSDQVQNTSSRSPFVHPEQLDSHTLGFSPSQFPHKSAVRSNFSNPDLSSKNSRLLTQSDVHAHPTRSPLGMNVATSAGLLQGQGTAGLPSVQPIPMVAPLPQLMNPYQFQNQLLMAGTSNPSPFMLQPMSVLPSPFTAGLLGTPGMMSPFLPPSTLSTTPMRPMGMVPQSNPFFLASPQFMPTAVNPMQGPSFGEQMLPQMPFGYPGAFYGDQGLNSMPYPMRMVGQTQLPLAQGAPLQNPNHAGSPLTSVPNHPMGFVQPTFSYGPPPVGLTQSSSLP